MSQNKDLAKDCGEGGRFTDVDGLLPLFADPDARGSQRWREAFGLKCRRGKLGADAASDAKAVDTPQP
jgi:hypothetical protein